MKNVNTGISSNSESRHGRFHAQRGFSLTELIIAMAVFVVVAGAAFSLFGQQAEIATQQQNLSGVNVGLRNGISQMEMDMAGGGGNLLSGVVNATPFYMSVIINNNIPGVAATCTPNTTNWSYPIPSACFDSYTILSPNNSLAKPCTTAGGVQAPPLTLVTATQVNVSTAQTVQANDANNVTANNTADASCYKSGDEVLLLQFSTSACDVSVVQLHYCMNVATLTHDATAGVPITLQLSAADTQADDPMGIMYTPGGLTYFANSQANLYPNGSYIVDIGTGSNAITYAVMANPSNANDPQLVRCPGMSCTTANAQVVTDQLIGFKVGADLWNAKNASATDIANYIYNGAQYCSDAQAGVDCTVSPPVAYDPYDFTLVRAVRVSLIGRTNPLINPTGAVFLNGFDNGPYFVQQAATVVDLRNLSNVDSTN